MKRWFVGVACVAAWSSGCATDLYAPCDLDPQSQNAAQRVCAAETTDTEQVSCAIENFFQCETTVCGRYEGSATYCTQLCQTDEECGEGECRDYNIISPGTARYCVPPSAL